MNDTDIAPSIDNPDQPALIRPKVTGVNEQSGLTRMSIRHLSAATDEPAEKGGADSAPTPLETALAALVGCEGVIIKGVAQAIGFAYDRAEFACEAVSDIRGARGVKGVRPHFQSVALTITLVTDEPENRVRLLTRNVEQRCPVMNLFQAANVDMDVRWITQPTGS